MTGRLSGTASGDGTSPEESQPLDRGPSLELVPEPRQFGPYTLYYRLADGGMATVYLAQRSGQGGFAKWMALKVIHPQYARSDRFVQMFLDEARLAARMSHPNICTVFDFGEASGQYYLAMEYLHGETLSQVIRRSRASVALPVHLAARIVLDAARGLHAAHELTDARGQNAGVVHRDVSPQNVFVLYDGVAKIVDFGIARFSDRLAEDTTTGEVKGKLAYMAPEQLRREPVDRRADIFALGVVLWESTLARRLFKRESTSETVMALLEAKVPRPSELKPGYPPELEQIVMRALATKPSERYATAEDLARHLELFLAKLGVPSGPSHVADYMRALFARDIAQRDELLRSDRLPPEGGAPRPSGAPSARPSATPPAVRPPADSVRSLPAVVVPSLLPEPEGATASMRGARPRGRRWAVGALLTVAAVAGTSATIALVRTGARAAPEAAARPSSATLPLITATPPPAPVVAAPAPAPASDAGTAAPIGPTTTTATTARQGRGRRGARGRTGAPATPGSEPATTITGGRSPLVQQYGDE